MKKYVKAEVVAKNNPQGSYAAGCPTKVGDTSAVHCKACETTK